MNLNFSRPVSEAQATSELITALDAETMAERELHAQPTSREASGAQTAKKRSRVQFSCTACRYRKLKCDRTYPCDRCTRRGEAASCTFVGHGPRGRASEGGSSPTHIQNRIQHLENLVLSFAQQRRQRDGASPYASVTRKPNGSSLADPEAYVEDELVDLTSSTKASHIDKTLEDDPGKIVNEEDVGISYVDASHWRAILDDIKEVMEYLREEDVSSEDSDTETDEMDDSSRPSLLFGLGRPPSKTELLADLPERQVVDRLIARFLNSGDPMLVILHFPTFQSEYAQFWLNPRDVSVPWLGLLYACLTMSVGMYLRCEEALPSPLADPKETLLLFRRRCTHCLIHSNYTKPGRYKVEAMMMYATTEYTKKGNAPVSVSIIMGVLIKLAMRMGYHRDSKHYGNISVLEGEMRRRLWAVICQLDVLTSFQVGVPKQTQSWQCDTDLPRNIFDEDFDENTMELPPSRPESVRTPATYVISKSRIMSVFGRVCDLAFSRKPALYEEVLELDRRLEEAHESIASSLRMRPMDQSITDDPNLIMRRYTLDVLYQKARLVLHRKYLTEVHSDVRHSYSRWVCVHAAREILRHQSDLFHESQGGGRLAKHRWFFTSLQNHDFVLAAMIICLELSKNKPSEPQTRKHGFGFSVVLEGRDGLLKALEISRDIWETNLRHSVEARNAFHALTIMLKKAQNEDQDAIDARDTTLQSGHDHLTSSSGSLHVSSDDISIGESASTTGLGAAPHNPTASRDSDSSHSLRVIPTPPTSIGSGSINTSNNGSIPMPQSQTPPPTALGMIETMIDAPSNFDWHVWDGHMQEFEPGYMEQYWGVASTSSGIVSTTGAGGVTASGMSMQQPDYDMMSYHPMQQQR